MLEYLNFCLLCAIFTSIFYLYIRIKKYFPILKMVEELISSLSYGTPQSDTKCQKLLECVLNINIDINVFSILILILILILMIEHPSDFTIWPDSLAS